MFCLYCQTLYLEQLERQSSRDKPEPDWAQVAQLPWECISYQGMGEARSLRALEKQPHSGTSDKMHRKQGRAT